MIADPYRVIRDQYGNVAEVLPPRPTYLVGVDLAQASDYTAIAVLKRTKATDDAPAVYDLGHLERFQQVPYTRIGGIVRDRVAALRGIRPQPDVTVAYDRTAVGAAAGDVMEEAGIDGRLVAITIHGGDQVSGDEHHGFRVPKRDLVSATAVVMQAERLRISTQLTLAPVLAEELGNFKMTISKTTGHDSYESWRENVHDDMVLATAMGLWLGERNVWDWTDIPPAWMAAWLRA
ncbi:MAG: hypothetical protein QOJ59_575 [Thermomicrobiales bacterium]|jgi:hypothetical protein|nr:hypothetical protein [Thermomicrobiales bacterium]